MPHLDSVQHFAAWDAAVGTPQTKSRQGKPGHRGDYLYLTMLFEEARLVVDENCRTMLEMGLGYRCDSTKDIHLGASRSSKAGTANMTPVNIHKKLLANSPVKVRLIWKAMKIATSAIITLRKYSSCMRFMW